MVETPVVTRGMKLFGGLATAGIRGQVDGDQEHARTLPIYVDKKAFRKELGLSKEGDVYPFLVHRDTGRVLWGGQGEIDMDEVSGLERALADALDSPPAPVPAEKPDERPDEEAAPNEEA